MLSRRRRTGRRILSRSGQRPLRWRAGGTALRDGRASRARWRRTARIVLQRIRTLETSVGVEPPSLGCGQLPSPMTTNVVGAPGRNRTCDLPLTEGARYQTALLERYTLRGGWPLHLCSPAGWRRTQGWSCAVESNHISRFMRPAFTRVRARGGRWRIRTPEGLRPTAFQAVPLGHSGNLPVPTVLGRAPGALREAYTNRLGRPLRSRTVSSRI